MSDGDASVSVKLAASTVTVDKATGRATFTLPGTAGPMTGPNLNLGQGRLDNGDFGHRDRPQWVQSKSAPVLVRPDVRATTADHRAFVTVAADVTLAEHPGRRPRPAHVHARPAPQRHGRRRLPPGLDQ